MPYNKTKSIFDYPDPNQPNTSTTTSTSTSTNSQNDVPQASSSYPHESDTASVFTQSTSTSTIVPESNSNGLFSRLRSKSSTKESESRGLLPNNDPAPPAKKEKGKFGGMFKPHEPTEKDLEIMAKLRERLGSQEEAVKRGGAQPAGYKGMNGGMAMGAGWSTGM